MTTRPIQFIRRGEIVSAGNVPPDRTLLDFLREDCGETGTKEGCGEGDCGACTVVLGEPKADGSGVAYKAVNSCIKLAHSIDGLALWTVEDLAFEADDNQRPAQGPSLHPAQTPSLHPAQAAMVECHGSQCGFCTPGFVMSLFATYQNHVVRGEAVTREIAVRELAGNLCRCTGYRPIVDAAMTMGERPIVRVDETALLSKWEHSRSNLPGLSGDFASNRPESGTYEAPRELDRLLALRAADSAAQLVAGCTDVGLWITKLHRRYDRVIDTTRCDALQRIERADGVLSIGAAATLHDAFAALVAEWPELDAFAARFAGLPVRNAGTLGGNVANGSPIGDSMPLLIALGAEVVLASAARGERRMPLEDFYVGYRQTRLEADEVLVRIEVPCSNQRHPFVRVYKISKRYEDDISAVCVAIHLTRDAAGVVAQVRIGAGGVAATPARARRAEASLAGRAWTEATAAEAGDVLAAEFTPIGDMRASAAYRTALLRNLMRRFWLESQGVGGLNLEDAGFSAHDVTLSEIAA